MLSFLNKQAAGMLTEDAYRGFCAHLNRYATLTRKSYSQVIGRFVATVPKRIRYITVEHVENFILSGNYLASSRNYYLMAVRCFYNYLENTHGIENIAKRVKQLKTQPPKQRVITKAEYQKLMESLDEKAKTQICALAMTGLRRSEFVKLRPENVIDGFLRVITAKTNKPRGVPLNPTAQQLIRENPTLNFSKTSASNLYYRCRRAAKKAGLEPFGPHALRHFFATQLIINNVERTKVAKMMGITVQTLDKVYVHLQDLDLAGTTDCLDI